MFKTLMWTEETLTIMDEKDKSILQLLERDARLSSRAVAARVRLPISTVYRRIRRMEQDGVIKGYRAFLDYEKTEWPIGAFFFINIEEITHGRGHIPKEEIIRGLKKFREIRELSDVQGGSFDLIVKARFGSLRELSAFTEELRSIEGIEELSTVIITQEL